MQSSHAPFTYAAGAPDALDAGAATHLPTPPAATWRPVVVASVMAYLAVCGALLAVWLVWSQRASPALAASACSLPFVLGAWLCWRPDPDDRQFTTKLFAATMFGPTLLAFWAGGEPSQSGSAAWPFMLSATVLHLGALVGAVVWLGGYTTRVAPVAGVAAVDPTLLRSRLLSLIDAGIPADTEPTAATVAGPRVVFHIRLPDPARCHRVILQLDAARRRVRVFERISARGARPLDAAEASMRGPGDAAHDPSRPDAQFVASTTWQTTMIELQRLAALQPTLWGERASLPTAQCEDLDAESVVTLLCAVVTRSGWTWQPGWRG